jgi:5-methyltetrahydropteroyltriglutamate--homocysteine methyltransferase
LAGKQVLLGVIDLTDPVPETAEVVAARIRAGLAYVGADKLVPAPDCGMKYVPRALAFAKLKALSQGAALVRATLG